MSSAIINAAVIFSLVLSNVQSYSLPDNHVSTDELPINRNSDTGATIPLSTNSKWTFNEDERREPRQSFRTIYEKRDRILFPDSNQAVNPRMGLPSCVGATVCEDVTDYPWHLTNEILKNYPHLRGYHNVDELDNIALRIDDPSTPLCPSHERVMTLRAAKNTNDEWMYIINTDNFTQGVRIETCMNEGQTCKLIGDTPAGYVTSCKQKHILRQLVAIKQDHFHVSPVHDLFRIPASCCCHIEFNPSLAAERFLF